MTSQTACIVVVLRIRVATTRHQGHRATYGVESLLEFQRATREKNETVRWSPKMMDVPRRLRELFHREKLERNKKK